MEAVEEKPRIGAIAPWFGAKRTLANRIVAEFGPHRAYWELFCGSMAVLLAKPRAAMETVNDLNRDLVNLARVIRHETLGPKLYRMLRRTLMSEELYSDAAEQWQTRCYGITRYDSDSGCLEAAYIYFVASWLGRNGVSGTKGYNQRFCVRYSASGGSGATRFQSAVDSIPSWRKRIREITILSRDAFELIEKIPDDERTVIYVDPPYLRKASKYVHDFADLDRHHKLCELLRRFKKSRIVVSYYDEPELSMWYSDWTKVRLKANKALANASQRDEKKIIDAPEILFINGPSYTED